MFKRKTETHDFDWAIFNNKLSQVTRGETETPALDALECVEELDGQQWIGSGTFSGQQTVHHLPLLDQSYLSTWIILLPDVMKIIISIATLRYHTCNHRL